MKPIIVTASDRMRDDLGRSIFAGAGSPEAGKGPPAQRHMAPCPFMVQVEVI